MQKENRRVGPMEDLCVPPLYSSCLSSAFKSLRFTFELTDELFLKKSILVSQAGVIHRSSYLDLTSQANGNRNQ
jgi:hypothetical protein